MPPAEKLPLTVTVPPVVPLAPPNAAMSLVLLVQPMSLELVLKYQLALLMLHVPLPSVTPLLKFPSLSQV
jgi:hypothetical protein